MKLKQQIFYDDDNIRKTAEELLTEYSPGEFSQLWEDFLFALDPEASISIIGGKKWQNIS